MAITLDLTTKPRLAELRKGLAGALPQYKIKVPLLNSNATMVHKGAAMVLVSYTNRGFKIAGGVNTSNFGVALGAGIGVLFGIIGAFIFLGIVYMLNQENFQRMEQEVADAIRGMQPEENKA